MSEIDCSWSVIVTPFPPPGLMLSFLRSPHHVFRLKNKHFYAQFHDFLTMHRIHSFAQMWSLLSQVSNEDHRMSEPHGRFA